MFIEHYLQHVRDYAFPMPFAENIKQAPLFQTLKQVPECKIDTPTEEVEKIKQHLIDFMEKRK